MILFLTDSDRDYGADYLYDGFCELLGPRQVLDWPPKASLHLAADTTPLFDCDLRRPYPAAERAEAVPDLLRDGALDLLVVPTLRGQVPGILRSWSRAGLLERMQHKTVTYDAEDANINTGPYYAAMLGYRPAAYFKRELPCGETWATPLPFGYPASRLVPLGDKPRAPLAVYAAQTWSSNMWMRRQLATIFSKPPFSPAQGGTGRYPAFALAPTSDYGRLQIGDYHAINQQASVAVSPAGNGYFTNRHLEVIADGCCPVIEAPTCEFPDAFVDHAECRYFRTSDAAAEIVRELLDDRRQAHALAKAAQAKFLACHTTRHRAETVWRAVYGR
jgi:hypothetical protein